MSEATPRRPSDERVPLKVYCIGADEPVAEMSVRPGEESEFTNRLSNPDGVIVVSAEGGGTAYVPVRSISRIVVSNRQQSGLAQFLMDTRRR